MGEVLIAQSIPRLIFLLVGGVVADRLPRRLILLWSDGGRALVVLVIAALGGLHVLQFWHLIGLSVLFGVAGAFFFPAYQSLPPQLVEAEDLTSANALVGLGRQLSTLVGPALGAGFVGPALGAGFVGPALGAGFVALAGPASAFAFDGVTFVVSALCLAVMRVPVAVGAEGPEARTSAEGASQEPRRGVLGMLADVPAGFAYVMRFPWLWVTIAIASLGNVFWSTLQVSLPKLVHDVYGVGVWLLGAMLSADAIGALIVTLVVGQRRRLRHRGIIAYLAIALATRRSSRWGYPIRTRLHHSWRSLLDWSSALASVDSTSSGSRRCKSWCRRTRSAAWSASIFSAPLPCSQLASQQWASSPTALVPPGSSSERVG